jgi:hypothetical protein
MIGLEGVEERVAAGWGGQEGGREVIVVKGIWGL